MVVLFVLPLLVFFVALTHTINGYLQKQGDELSFEINEFTDPFNLALEVTTILR